MAAAADVNDDDDDPAHPCPICLENEDDIGECGQCFACGRQYCGDCNVAETIGQIVNPIDCRELFTVSHEVNVERLTRLVARSPGRHMPAAQVNLGTMYQDGTGVPQDLAECARLYRLAADQGHATGQANLGMMYTNGTGIPQDHTEAARLYRLAADQGHACGQANLGMTHANGTGVLLDRTEAARLPGRGCTASPPTRGTPAGRSTSG